MLPPRWVGQRSDEGQGIAALSRMVKDEVPPLWVERRRVLPPNASSRLWDYTGFVWDFTINLYVIVPLFLVMPMRTALYKSSQLLFYYYYYYTMKTADGVSSALPIRLPWIEEVSRACCHNVSSSPLVSIRRGPPMLLLLLLLHMMRLKWHFTVNCYRGTVQSSSSTTYIHCMQTWQSGVN